MKVLNYSELHFSKLTSLKIHTLVDYLLIIYHFVFLHTDQLDDLSPYKVRSDNIKSTPQKNFIKEKIIELSKDITTDGDESLNPKRNGATTLKNALESKYQGTKWFVALFESDEYYSHSTISAKAFLKADYNEVYWLVVNLS